MDTDTLRKNFFGKISKDVHSDCILFIGARNQGGYGRLWDGERLRLAHHVSWFLRYGVWPTMQLLHTCDTPSCVKPAHLFEGTQKQNMEDKVAKGRQPKGPDIPSAKLCDADVLEIYRMCDARIPTRDIADRFGVNPQTIYTINQGRMWTHLSGGRRPKKAYACTMVEIDGERLSIAEVATRARVTPAAISARLRRGLRGRALLAHTGRGRPKWGC